MGADGIIILGMQSISDDASNTIVERGTHQELLDARGIYAKIHHIQSAEAMGPKKSP